MGHLGSKKRERAREKRLAREAGKPQRSSLPDTVAAATGLSGTYCAVHGTYHSPKAAEEMGCFA